MPSPMKCKTMVGPGKKYKTMDECLSYGGKKMGKMKKKAKMKKPMLKKPKLKAKPKMGHKKPKLYKKKK